MSDLPGEHADSTGDVAGNPGNRDVPGRLQGHHDEGHDKVSHRQVHYKQVHARLPVPEEKRKIIKL